ncbi:hypothetical protein H4R33_002625 [Dimargaris cristalligena]|nr:hypothetical protein H4R33_002625 [Dimargaris cristalligena]
MDSLALEIDDQVKQILAALLSDEPQAEKVAAPLHEALEKSLSSVDNQLTQRSQTLAQNPRIQLCQEIIDLKGDIRAKQLVVTKCQQRLAQFETSLAQLEASNAKCLMNS